MRRTMILTGDVNLRSVTDPTVPFRKVASTLTKANIVFANMECCLADPPPYYSTEQEGFYAGAAAGEALKHGGFHGVGIANNVNWGAEPIRGSIARLDELGVVHTGAGVNRQAARAPAVIARDGLRVGFLQRTSVYWPANHEAGANSTGVAALKAHTAFLPRVANRPGVPPIIVTWADKESLAELVAEIKALKEQVDVVVASHHWGYDEQVYEYQKEVAHADIDAGADVVMGHGPHFPLGLEVYKSKPIFYGLGSFSFHTGHRAVHGDWVGLMARITLDDSEVVKAAFVPVRHNAQNETVARSIAEEKAAIDHIVDLSKALGTTLEPRDDEVVLYEKKGRA